MADTNYELKSQKWKDEHEPEETHLECRFCGLRHYFTNLTRISTTQDLICDPCAQEMTLQRAVEYIKGNEPKCDPEILCQFINELWPHNKPEGYQK